MTTTRIALILGSDRPTRFVEKPAAWLLDKANAHEGVEAEIVDPRDFDLPFFADPASNAWMETPDPKVKAWQDKLAGFDAFIFVTPEYNHSITAVLKNAIDQAYKQWVRKPMGVMGYGGVGAARAVEHLRGIAIEMQMAPVRAAVHLGGGEFMKVHPMGQNADMSEVDAILAPSAEAMLNDLVWWSNALKPAREAAQAQAA